VALGQLETDKTNHLKAIAGIEELLSASQNALQKVEEDSQLQLNTMKQDL